MSFVTKISKPGYDVREERDPRNFIYDSSYNHLKTAKTGSFQKTLGEGASATEAIAHTLGYRPLALSYWMADAEAKWRIASTDPEHSVFRPNTNANVSIYCDNTYVYFNVYNGYASGGDRAFTIKYEIFYEGDA